MINLKQISDDLEEIIGSFIEISNKLESGENSISQTISTMRTYIILLQKKVEKIQFLKQFLL